jgi:hypothetical protein
MEAQSAIVGMRPLQRRETKIMEANLINAVVRQLGYRKITKECRETMSDICNNGIDGGFGKFIYYSDTVNFFKKNRAAIVEAVEEMANELGEDSAVMVAGFNCLKPCDKETRASIARCIYGGRLTEDDTQVANALSWFAAEEAARAVVDN